MALFVAIRIKNSLTIGVLLQMISSDDAKSAPFDVDRKRSADSMKSLPGTEHVCEMTIKNDFQPTHGHGRRSVCIFV